MRNLLTLFILLGFGFHSDAQSNDVLAKSYFLKAQENYSEGNTSSALESLDKTLEYLGTTNAKIEALYVKIALNQNDYLAAQKHLNRYFEYADESRSDYIEMLKFLPDVKIKVAEIKEKEREKLEIAKEKENLEEKLNKIRKLGVENGDQLFISEGLAAIKINNKWGFANLNGEIIIAIKYDQVYSFYEGLASVNQNGKWYFINKEDQIIINLPTGYSARKFREGFAKISGYESNAENGSFAIKFINKDGDIITKNTYDYASDFSENRARVVKNDLVGFIDTNGHEVIPLIYFKAGVFSEGLAPVFIKQGIWKWGYIDPSGNTIIDFNYNSISLFKNGLAKVEQNSETFQIDRTGKRIE